MYAVAKAQTRWHLATAHNIMLIRRKAVCISKGVAQYGTAVGLDAKYKVDLVVVGSSAVCPETGARVGKGEGFAELGTFRARVNMNGAPDSP